MSPGPTWPTSYADDYHSSTQPMHQYQQHLASSNDPIQQALKSFTQQATMPNAQIQNGGSAHATVSPAQLFQPSARTVIAPTPSQTNPTASSGTKAKEPRARKASMPIKGEPSQKAASPTIANLASQRPSQSQSPPLSTPTTKKATETAAFDKLKKDFLNPSSKYGWHGRFEDGKTNPLDEMTKYISDKNMVMTATQTAEFATLAYSGIPTAYTRAWKTHDQGLKLLSSLLNRVVEGLTAVPTGHWAKAAYKMTDVS